MKRALVLIFVFVLLAGFSGAFGYFQFVMKPEMIKGFITKAAPPPSTVAVTVATTDSWTPGLTAIGTLRAYQGIDVSSQLAAWQRGSRTPSPSALEPPLRLRI